MSLPLGELPDEVRRLVREHRIVANGWTGLPAEVSEDDEITLSEEGGPRRTEALPSSEEIRASWRVRYPDLASTDHLIALVPILRERLLEATAVLPHEFPRGPFCREDRGRLSALVAPVRRAVSIYARFTHAITMLRSVRSFETEEPDLSGYDAYALGGETMRDPRYRPYSRLIGKLGRSNPKVIAARKIYDADPERKAKRATYRRERLSDPAYRALENEKRRARYAAAKALAKTIDDALQTIDIDDHGSTT